MIDFLFILLGAFLAVIGGLLQQRYQNNLTEKRKDRELLHQAEEILIEMLPILEDLPASREELNDPCKRLLSIANRIWIEDSLELAERLIEFVRKEPEKTKENAIKLITDIAAKIGKALDRFHKKQDDLAQKAGEALKQIMEREDKARKEE